MKNIIKTFMILLLVAMLMAIKVEARPAGNVSFQVFYDNLSPYGQWVDDAFYGYVWVPSAGSDFQPYSSNGHWVMTEYGNAWASDYAWEWAPFHYGRRALNAYYGWIWIPDNNWGPAWVIWRSNSDCYGWAPMKPGISYAVYDNYHPDDTWWIFVRPAYIHHQRWHKYHHRGRNGRDGNTTMINNTMVINNTYTENNHTYISSPHPGDIKRVTHKEVMVYTVKNEPKPGKVLIKTREKVVNVYRPDTAKSGQENAPPKAKKSEHPLDYFETPL